PAPPPAGRRRRVVRGPAARVVAARVAARHRERRPAARPEPRTPAEAATRARAGQRDRRRQHERQQGHQHGQPRGSAAGPDHDRPSITNLQIITLTSGSVSRAPWWSRAWRVSTSRVCDSCSKYWRMVGRAWTRRWKYSRARKRIVDARAARTVAVVGWLA